MAARDWLHDCSSNHGIQVDAWRQSMFELVDLWEVGADPSSYLAFLETLLLRVGEPVSPLHVHRAIAKSWNPSAATSDARLSRWALAHVELRFRALNDVPKVRFDPNSPSLYSAGQEFRDDHDRPGDGVAQSRRPMGNFDVPQPVGGRVDEHVLARLEEFLADDTRAAIGSEDAVVDMVQMLAESRARFAAYIDKAAASTRLSLETCSRISGLSGQARQVRALFESSAAGREREAEQTGFSGSVRQAVDDLQWDVLTRNGFVDAVLSNEMFHRMGRIWNHQLESQDRPN